MDLVDLLPQALELANAVQPGAKLVKIVAGDVRQGEIDITTLGGALYFFECDGFDPKRPNDNERFTNAVTVVAGRGELSASASPNNHQLEGELGGKGLPTPCPSRKAWAVGRPQNVSNDVRMSFVYELGHSGPAQRREWHLSAPGPDGFYISLINSETCQLVSTHTPSRGKSAKPSMVPIPVPTMFPFALPPTAPESKPTTTPSEKQLPF